MSDLTPGTPEYKEAYDKEMQRLEAEAAKPADKPADKPAETPPGDGKPAPKADEAKPDDELAKVRKELETANKRVADTQRAFHENAARIKRLERDAEERKHAETRPAILDANPGLEEAITHIARPAQPEGTPEQRWLGTVVHAIPDVETLLGDQTFFAAAQARKAELGAEWDNPLTAIREFSALKTQHQSAQQSKAAVEAAQADFRKKAEKRPAMEVPGGAGGRDAPVQTDEVQKVWAMSDEDFRKQRSKVMGY